MTEEFAVCFIDHLLTFVTFLFPMTWITCVRYQRVEDIMSRTRKAQQKLDEEEAARGQRTERSGSNVTPVVVSGNGQPVAPLPASSAPSNGQPAAWTPTVSQTTAL